MEVGEGGLRGEAVGGRGDDPGERAGDREINREEQNERWKERERVSQPCLHSIKNCVSHSLPPTHPHPFYPMPPATLSLQLTY